MSILFVTGTDTGVGKTTVSAALLAALRDAGIHAGASKPIETGCERLSDGSLKALDVERLSLACGEPAHNCYAFETPAAPEVAARKEDRSIDVNVLRTAVVEAASGKDLLVVEGAGGLLVPIKDDYTFADLAADCGAHVLVVIGSRLGALNHAALTFEVLRARRLEIAGYVVSDLFDLTDTEQSSAVATNRELLAKMGARYELAELAHLEHFQRGSTKETTKDSEILRLSRTDGVQQLKRFVIDYFRLSRPNRAA